MLLEATQLNEFDQYSLLVFQIFLFAVFALWLLKNFADEALGTLKAVALKVVETFREIIQSVRKQK